MAPTFETADNDKKSPAFPNLFLPLTIQPEGNLDDKKFRKETHPSDVDLITTDYCFITFYSISKR